MRTAAAAIAPAMLAHNSTLAITALTGAANSHNSSKVAEPAAAAATAATGPVFIANNDRRARIQRSDDSVRELLVDLLFKCGTGTKTKGPRRAQSDGDVERVKGIEPSS